MNVCVCVFVFFFSRFCFGPLAALVFSRILRLRLKRFNVHQASSLPRYCGTVRKFDLNIIIRNGVLPSGLCVFQFNFFFSYFSSNAHIFSLWKNLLFFSWKFQFFFFSLFFLTINEFWKVFLSSKFLSLDFIFLNIQCTQFCFSPFF